MKPEVKAKPICQHISSEIASLSRGAEAARAATDSGRMIRRATPSKKPAPRIATKFTIFLS